MITKKSIPSVNFHLWEPCNMKCQFCFATFQDVKNTILPKGHLPKNQAIEIVKHLARFGFQKITFAGGEPTLCPWLPDLLKIAKELGMTSTIVTNGSRLTDDFLAKNELFLDWIAISIDSLNPNTNLSIGRTIGGKKPLSVEYYFSRIEKIRNMDIGLKINTVVNRYNYQENMLDFITKVQPERWKVFQVLPIKGENDENIDKVKISNREFNLFLQQHKSINYLVPENNDEMTNSYAMIDPAGRFFNNKTGGYQYSNGVLDVGCDLALSEMNYDFDKFINRGGLYDWGNK